MAYIPEPAIESIKRWEGLVDGDKIKPGLQPYRDPIGLWTIGYGHLISHNPRIPQPDMTLTMDEVDKLLRHDVQIYARSVRRLITTELTILQYSALISFTFNVGGANLEASTLRRVINRGDHQGVPKQFMRWVYAQGGIKLAGLIRRRRYESNMYVEGTT